MGWVEPYDVTAKAVLRYIRAAKLGDYQAALQLAKIFVSALRGKAPLYPPWRIFMPRLSRPSGKGKTRRTLYASTNHPTESKV
jgi:hypothetical protein